MGLDLNIIKHIGTKNNGYLNTVSPEIENWYSTRYSIRHEISKNIELETLSSGKEFDWEEYYRPSNFNEAFKWTETLNEGNRNYVEGILKILQENPDYWLEYSY